MSGRWWTANLAICILECCGENHNLPQARSRTSPGLARWFPVHVWPGLVKSVEVEELASSHSRKAFRPATTAEHTARPPSVCRIASRVGWDHRCCRNHLCYHVKCGAHRCTAQSPRMSRCQCRAPGCQHTQVPQDPTTDLCSYSTAKFRNHNHITN